MNERPSKAGLIRDVVHRAGLLTAGNKLTDLVGTAWRVFYSNGSGDLTELALGASGTALVSGGASAAPSFVDVATQAELDTHAAAADPHAGYVLESLVDAKGDLITATAADTVARLAVGSNNQVLTADSAQSTGLKWASASSMLKTQNTGYFFIPAGPSVGTTVTSGGANTYGSWTEMIASTSAALYIVGVTVRYTNGTYVQVKFGTGAGGAETAIGEARFIQTSNVGQLAAEYFPLLIPVATSTRIACQTASSAATEGVSVTLICVAQADTAGV